MDGQNQQTHLAINWTKIFLSFFGLLILLVLIGLGFLVSFYYRFSKESGLTAKQIWQRVYFVIKNRESNSNKKINFLILGLDERNDELEKTMLTDTIIFASLNTSSGKLTFIPIPRDLWIDSLKTKINALYFYGETGENKNGIGYLKDQIQEITGQSIDYWMMVDYNHFASLINILGTVEVYVEKGFTDDYFPNPKYIASTTSGEPKYISIKFDQGWQDLSGERAVELIRSRMSTDITQGSDLGRSSRQMQLLKGIVDALKKPNELRNPEKLGKLYKFWETQIKTNLPDEQLLTLAWIIVRKGIQIEGAQIPASYDSQAKDAILVNPSLAKYGLWVWEPRVGDWSQLKAFIEKSIQ
jgi:LCP family protein required for cell wall assembly